MRSIVIGLSVVAAAACSSTSSSNSSSSSSGSSCGCSLNINGEAKDLACGGSACIGGTTYNCSNDSEISQGSACTSTTRSDAGKAECSPTTDCPAITCSCPPLANVQVSHCSNGKCVKVCSEQPGCF